MKLLRYFEKSRDFWFLLIITFVFFLLRFPSLLEPYWYGDEGIYQTIATAMNHGSLLYRDIWDNKPPLLYIFYAIFNGDQFSLRLLSLIFGVMSIVVFFFLIKKIVLLNKTHSTLPTYTATALFAFLLAIPLFEGNIANAENFMILPIVTAGYLVSSFVQRRSVKGLFYAGFFLSLAFLFKTVAIFDFAAFVLFLFMIVSLQRRLLVKEILLLLPIFYGFILPILLTLLFFAFQGGLYAYISAVFAQNIGYVAYGNTFIIPQGLLYIKLLLLLCIILFLFYQRKNISQGSLFIYLWLVFSLCNAFFSQRPYTHYILVFLPSFCLFTILVVEDFTNKIHSSFNIRFIHSGLLVFLIFLILYNFDIYKKNIAYYQNFCSFIIQEKSLDSYQRFFDPDVPKDYAVAQFLRNHTKKNATVFIWGNPAQIYKMSQTLPPGRFTVTYHITHSKENIAETKKALDIKEPKFIVIFSSHNFPFNLSSYRYIYSIQGASLYEFIL